MNSNIRLQTGFTLIELMIVLAIVGILAGIAIPFYTSYTKKAHVSEGIVLASGAKASVTEYYSTNNTWPSSNPEAGLSAPTSINGNAVAQVAVNSSGVIQITYNAKVTTGATVTLIPSNANGSVIWNCTGGTVNTRYRPNTCR